MTLKTLDELDEEYGNPRAFAPYKDLRQWTYGAHIINLPRLRKRKYPVIFDMGAYKGEMIEFYKEVIPNCTIYATEPDRTRAKMLLERYENDKQVIIIQKALVGSGPEEQEFTETLGGLSSGISDRFIPHPSKKHGKVVNKYKVETTTIAQLMKEYGIAYVDYCKLNVENVELDILKHLLPPASNSIGEVCTSVHTRTEISELIYCLEFVLHMGKVLYYPTNGRVWAQKDK